MSSLWKVGVRSRWKSELEIRLPTCLSFSLIVLYLTVRLSPFFPLLITYVKWRKGFFENILRREPNNVMIGIRTSSCDSKSSKYFSNKQLAAVFASGSHRGDAGTEHYGLRTFISLGAQCRHLHGRDGPDAEFQNKIWWWLHSLIKKATTRWNPRIFNFRKRYFRKFASLSKFSDVSLTWNAHGVNYC